MAEPVVNYMRLYRLFLFVLCSLCTAVCGCMADEEVLGGLQVQEAIEIVVSLKNAGIAAHMQKSGGARSEKYSVFLPRSERMAALRVLNDLHLPRPVEESFAGLTEGDGFIPNLRETANLRLDRALGVEIERSIAALEGVVEAKAIVRSHLVKADGFAGDAPRPTASVVIRYTSRSGNQPFTDEEVRTTVSKAVPGLSAEDVSISATRVFVSNESPSLVGIDGKNNMVPLAPAGPFPFLVPASDSRRVVSIISVFLGGFILLGLGIGWSLASFRRKPKGPPPKMVRTAMIEASFKGPALPGERNLPPGSKGSRALPPKGN